LVGIGAILFVASNWEKIGDTLKVLLLAGSTLGIHYTGYHFRYEESKYLRLGTALLLSPGAQRHSGKTPSSGAKRTGRG